MTNTAATKIRKKRNWYDGAGMGGAYRASPHSRQLGTSNMVDCKETYHSDMDDIHTLMAMYETNRSQQRCIIHVLPLELIELVLAQLDGTSLLQCSLVCRIFSQLTYDRNVWKNICMKKWPTLRTQVLPQLPGAPDYDLIRLYGGSWRQCFLQQHQFNQRAEIIVPIPQFPSITVEKVVSETFSIQDHRFCLWIFPHGNPNEPQYAHKVLSVYLVLTDLDRRPPQWLTCAVFSLTVVNHVDPSKTIEWHSCLVDNKFDAQLNNWGVHSLGSLDTLRDSSAGYLTPQINALTITARVRLMSITFRIVFESDMKAHHGFGLVDMTQTHTIVLPFCASLNDLLQKLQETFGLHPSMVNVWCFNQPVVSGQALRPRKLLTHAKANKTQPMFGHVLCDGVDIDAYSFCLLYVECRHIDEPVLNDTKPYERSWCQDCGMEEDSEDDISDSERESESEDETEMELEPTSSSDTLDGEYLFVKVMHYETHQLEYLGRFRMNDPAQWSSLTASPIYDCVARRLGCSPNDLLMFKAEIAPTMYSGPIPMFPTSSPNIGLQSADIVLFTHLDTYLDGFFESSMKQLLFTHYLNAQHLVEETLRVPTLEQIENLAECLDIPKFRIRSAFRKCHEDGRNTLRYIMEGRHLGFICDSCGETDFKGRRYNCTVCSDYDLCPACHVKSHEVSHRYANVDGKWQRIYDFKDHKTNHTMREMLPVFYRYDCSDGQLNPMGKNIDKTRTQMYSRDEIRMASIA